MLFRIQGICKRLRRLRLFPENPILRIGATVPRLLLRSER